MTNIQYLHITVDFTTQINVVYIIKKHILYIMENVYKLFKHKKLVNIRKFNFIQSCRSKPYFLQIQLVWLLFTIFTYETGPFRNKWNDGIAIITVASADADTPFIQTTKINEALHVSQIKEQQRSRQTTSKPPQNGVFSFPFTSRFIMYIADVVGR